MMVIYQIKVGLSLIAFYLLFKLLLSHDTLHRFNRVLLMALVVLALALPWLHLNLGTPLQGAMVVVEGVFAQPMDDAGAAPVSATAPVEWGSVLNLVYAFGALAVIVWQLWSSLQLRRLLRRGRRVAAADGTVIHIMPTDVQPFSYFRHIVISEADYRNNPREILTHERAHIRLGHSFDVLLMNVLCIVQWWNPAAWLLRRELQQIHEYEADEAVLKEGVDARQYQLLLIRKSVGNQLFSMANNLNHNSLKQRIRMMKKQRQSRWLALKALAVVPVAALLAVACGQKSEKAAETEEPLTVGVEVPSAATNPEVAVTGYEGAEAEEVFEVVEQMPEFPGGTAELMKYLSQNLKYPKEAEAAKEEGRVIVNFVVETDGRVTDARVVKGVSPLLDAEALRVVQIMPAWTPGRQNGEAVRVKYTVPFTFRLQ